MKKFVSYLFIGILAGAATLFGYKHFFEKPTLKIIQNEDAQPKALKTHFVNSPISSAVITDFTEAAAATVDAVVHVKNTAVQTYHNPIEEFFYGRSTERKYTQIGTGSGVIISQDGYIITNYHVVKDATDIQITMNDRRVYTAELVGADEKNDIALIKIDAGDLPYITFADSNNLKLGEWVLAVGNPYNLTSTVTAGIVSAKGRDLDGNNRRESYIQTDAAVNYGNSGGALVNTRGELVGINTAITSSTGSYIGYSFAIPSNIAKKVVEDLMEFGDVQQAFLGVNIVELDGKNAKKLGVPISEGIYVSEVIDNGAAAAAGIKEEDIIIKIDNTKISKFSDLTGQLSAHRPGESVNITVLRDGKEAIFPVVLKNRFGKEMFSKTQFIDTFLGLELEEPTKKERNKHQVSHGVKIVKINNPSFKRYGIKEGAIILSIEREKVYTPNDVERLLRYYDNRDYITLRILNTNNEIEYISLEL